MANKKKGGKKGAARNSASVKSARPAANKKIQNTAKPKQQKKKGGYKRNSGWLANLGRSGVGVKTVIGATGGLFAGEAAAAALPQSITGDLILVAGGFGVAWLLGMFSLTKDYAVGAGIGVGAVGAKNGLNRVTNGAVTNFFTGITNSTRGYLQPAPQPALANGAGMGRVINFR